MTLRRATVLIGILLVFAPASSAVTEADQQSAKIESVLDKLETKYLDRESAPLTYDEQRIQAMSGQKPVDQTITVKPREPILGKTPNQRILEDIQVKINEYENQVDALEADARKMKSQIIQGSVTKNMVTIEVKLKDEKTAGLQALTAKIDGSLMLNQTDPAGVWIPAALISVYQGPMQPGEHTIDISAVLNKTNANGLAVSGWIPQQVQETFKLTVPEGQTQKHLIIELDTSSNKSGKAVAVFIDKSPAKILKEDE